MPMLRWVIYTGAREGGGRGEGGGGPNIGN